MKPKIEAVNCVVGREKVSLLIPKGKNIKYLEVKLSNKVSFDVEIDNDGDVVITGNNKVKVLSEQENELIIKIKKSN